MKNSLLRLQLRRLQESESGQTLVLVALGAMMFLMMVGLGVDVGWLHYQKQQMQKAADSAALAGAEALTYGSNATQAAQSDATVNGFANGQNGITVTVNNPPQTVGDPFLGNSSYVEVIVAQARPSFFMKVASMNWASVNVRSRAVASTTASGSGCMYALDPTDSKTLVLNGNVTVSSSCGVYVDSTSANALVIDGSSGSLSASAGIGVVGPSPGMGWSGSGFDPTPVNIPPFTDPLASLPAPAVNGPCRTYVAGQQNPPAGTYCGGISISGGATVNFSGTYILCGGGMSVGGNSTITGTNVLFYNTGNVKGLCPGNNYSPINIVGTSGTTLSAVTTGTYAGILFFQDRNYVSSKNVDASSINGGAGATFTGALYFPGTDLTYAGNPNVNVSSLIIAYQITINGNTTINNNLLVGGGSPIQTAALAE